MKFIILYFVLFGCSYFILRIREKVRNIQSFISIESSNNESDLPSSIWLSVICPPMGIVFGIVDIILWKLNI